MMLLTAHKCPERVVGKAAIVLRKYGHRHIRPCWILTTGFLSLRVSPGWRLLSRDEGKSWELMSHERYNGAKDGK